MRRVIYAALFLLTTVAATGDAIEVRDPEEWISQAEAAYDEITSYTAILHKQQRIAGELFPEETILIKFKKPFSLYLKWIEEPHKGSELLYVQGWNEDRVRAHRGGFVRFITRDLEPTAPELMKDNLRPVTDIGIGQLVNIVVVNIRKAIEAEDLTFSALGEEAVYGRTTRILEITFPQASANEYDGYRFVINQDVESRILIRIRNYDQNGELVESYGYENLDLDAQLTDADFAPDHPDYHF
jgi:outer membrane lipoprotein-sorting protein